jgi:hypothetical protein
MRNIWVFEILWTIMIAIGWTAGRLVGARVGHGVLSYGHAFEVGFLLVALLLYGGVVGSIVGLSQWLLLKTQINISRKWIVKSAVAASLGQVLAFPAAILVMLTALLLRPILPTVVQSYVMGMSENLVAAAVVGSTISGAQYSTLKPFIAKPKRWIWVNGIGWCLGELACIYSYPMLHPPSLSHTLGNPLFGTVKQGGILENLIGGCVVGAITGICLIGLLRSTRRRLV